MVVMYLMLKSTTSMDKMEKKLVESFIFIRPFTMVNTIQQHSTPTFSIPNTPYHFLSLNSTPIQLLPSPMVFSFNTLPHHLLFLILI